MTLNPNHEFYSSWTSLQIRIIHFSVLSDFWEGKKNLSGVLEEFLSRFLKEFQEFRAGIKAGCGVAYSESIFIAGI